MAARKRKPAAKAMPPSRALAQSKGGRRARGLRRLDVWLPEAVLAALDEEAKRRGSSRAAMVVAAIVGACGER